MLQVSIPVDCCLTLPQLTTRFLSQCSVPSSSGCDRRLARAPWRGSCQPSKMGRACDEGKTPAPRVDQALTAVITQCLWKVSKTVKESLENGALSAPRLLRDINQFLVTTPPAEWRRRSSDSIPLADMPLRTVKTILQQVVSVFGEQVFDELDEIESAENSFVYQYLLRLANTSPAAPSAASSTARRGSADSDVGQLRSGAMGRQASGSSITSVRREAAPSRLAAASPPLTSSPVARTASTESNVSVASPGGVDIEINNSLKAIFDLIGDPTRSREVRAVLLIRSQVN